MRRTRLYGFAYTEAALKALKDIPARFRTQIRERIAGLANDPYPQGCKRLEGVKNGNSPVYRLRSGDYRVLYVVKGNPHQIIILDVGDRKDIYR